MSTILHNVCLFLKHFDLSGRFMYCEFYGLENIFYADMKGNVHCICYLLILSIYLMKYISLFCHILSNHKSVVKRLGRGVWETAVTLSISEIF